MNQNTSKTLGKNPLDSYGDADPAKAVVSSSAATNAPTRLVPFTIMQRNARSLGYDYLNADGKAVRSYSYDWISKTTYNDSVGTYLYVEDYYIDTANKRSSTAWTKTATSCPTASTRCAARPRWQPTTPRSRRLTKRSTTTLRNPRSAM